MRTVIIMRTATTMTMTVAAAAEGKAVLQHVEHLRALAEEEDLSKRCSRVGRGHTCHRAWLSAREEDPVAARLHLAEQPVEQQQLGRGCHNVLALLERLRLCAREQVRVVAAPDLATLSGGLG